MDSSEVKDSDGVKVLERVGSLEKVTDLLGLNVGVGVGGGVRESV